MSGKDPDFLSLDDLFHIAEGVLPEVLMRDVGFLESAAARPQTTVLGEFAYPSFAEMVAALMHSLARNHPLIDGNKRLAWSAIRAFILLNGRDIKYTVDDAEQLVLCVARGEMEVSEITEWCRQRPR